MPRCRACGQEIVFVKMKTGKSMPVNAERLLYWEDENGPETLVTPNGEIVKGYTTGKYEEATGYAYESHFASCPAADEFRRRKRK